MRIWAGYIQQDPRIDAMAHIDDRTFWCCERLQGAESPAFATLQAAKTRSDHFDTVFGFMCRASTCTIAALGQPAAQDLHTVFGYKFSHVLQIFGIQHHIGMPAATAAAKIAVRKAELRLQYMAMAPIPHIDEKFSVAPTHVVCCVYTLCRQAFGSPSDSMS